MAVFEENALIISSSGMNAIWNESYGNILTTIIMIAPTWDSRKNRPLRGRFPKWPHDRSIVRNAKGRWASPSIWMAWSCLNFLRIIICEGQVLNFIDSIVVLPIASVICNSRLSFLSYTEFVDSKSGRKRLVRFTTKFHWVNAHGKSWTSINPWQRCWGMECLATGKRRCSARSRRGWSLWSKTHRGELLLREPALCDLVNQACSGAQTPT